MSKSEFDIPAFVREHMPTFLSNREDDLKAARLCLQQQDAEGLHRIFHRIYGIAAPYGLPQLGTLSRQIIDCCKQNNLAGAKTLVGEVEVLLQRVKQALD